MLSTCTYSFGSFFFMDPDFLDRIQIFCRSGSELGIKSPIRIRNTEFNMQGLLYLLTCMVDSSAVVASESSSLGKT